LIVTYTDQHNFKTTEFDNDLENLVIRVIINDGEEVIEHDLSDYKEPENDEEEMNPPGFPIVGFPKYVDGELHVKLIRWYQ